MKRFPVLLLVLILPLLVAAGSARADDAAKFAGTPRLEGGFAPARPNTGSASYRRASADTKLYESFQGNDALTGRFSQGPFKGPEILEIYAAGYVNEPGRGLWLERDDGARLKLGVRTFPGEAWERLRWALPEGWRDRMVTLVAEDHTGGGGGWLGVSGVLKPSWQLGTALTMAGLQVLVCVWLLLPGLAAATFARGADFAPARRLILVLLGSGLAAYLVFILTVAQRDLGRWSAWVIVALAAGLLVKGRDRFVEMLRDRDFTLPLLLCIAMAVFCNAGNLLYGVLENPTVPMNRCLPGMPADVILPMMHADVLFDGRPLQPFAGDWLTSDRPPGQTALVLLARPLDFASQAHYLQVGIAAQCWVWLGLCALLNSLGLSRRATLLVLAGSCFSGFFFFNTLFCWPKLLPTAYLLGATALLFGRGRREPMGLKAAVLAGLCVGLAMLGHGGSFFGLLGIVSAYLIQRRPLNAALVLAPAIAVGTVMAPWFAYQKFYDPPGDRLVKFHLAGREAVDPRPATPVILEAYRQTPLSTLLENRVDNLRCLFGGNTGVIENSAVALECAREGNWALAFAVVGRTSRESGFFHYALTLGALLPGLGGLAWLCFRPRAGDANKEDAGAARTLGLIFATSAFLWCMLMFTKGSTVIHQGSYLSGACLFAATCLGLAVFPRWLQFGLLALNAVHFACAWLVAAPTNPVRPPGDLLTASVPGQWCLLGVSGIMILLCIVALGRGPLRSESPNRRAGAAWRRSP